MQHCVGTCTPGVTTCTVRNALADRQPVKFIMSYAEVAVISRNISNSRPSGFQYITFSRINCDRMQRCFCSLRQRANVRCYCVVHWL